MSKIDNEIKEGTPHFKKGDLKPLVDIGLVEPTIKDSPNSPKQKYALTDNGREKLQTIL